MNKYLEILLNGFDEESDSEMIAKIQSIADYEESIEIVNIFVALYELKDSPVIQAVWDEFSRLEKESAKS